MVVRGVIVTYETIRQWCAKFGPVYAAGLRRRQPPAKLTAPNRSNRVNRKKVVRSSCPLTPTQTRRTRP